MNLFTFLAVMATPQAVCFIMCRLLEVMTNRITDVHPVDKPIVDLTPQNILRVEVGCVTNISFPAMDVSCSLFVDAGDSQRRTSSQGQRSSYPSGTFSQGKSFIVVT